VFDLELKLAMLTHFISDNESS